MQKEILEEIAGKYGEYLEMGGEFESALMIKLLTRKLEDEIKNRKYLERRLKSCDELIKGMNKNVSTHTTN